MRNKIIIGLAILAAILVVIWLLPVKPRAGPWRLADGSELSLAGVTYGKKHVMHYGNGVADYLYPILSPELRKKFGCKEATITTTDTNAIVIWLWDKGVVWATGMAKLPPPAYCLAAVDEHGVEYATPIYPNSIVVWRATNVLEGMELKIFPRRGKEIGIRIFPVNEPSHTVAEFKILNRTATNYPVWTANQLPVTAKTNDLEITLGLFETGISQFITLSKGLGRATNYSTRSRFSLMENKKPAADNWRVESGSANSASGERRDNNGSGYGRRATDHCLLYFPGTLWAEEPAWKLKVKVSRIANYPPEELWTIKGVEIPARGKITESGHLTNIYGSEIELMAVSGARTSYSSISYVADFPALHVRSPVPSADTHLEVVEIKDDLGRSVQFRIGVGVYGTGGRGATIRELHQSFLLTIPEGAKTLDVTLAYTKSVFVEFMAKPTIANAVAAK